MDSKAISLDTAPSDWLNMSSRSGVHFRQSVANPMKTFISLIVWLFSPLLFAQTATAPQQRGVVSSTDDAYVKEMPTPERVIAEIRGTNALDTAARQMGTFLQLHAVMKTMMGERWPDFTLGERRLSDSYYAASGGMGREFVWDAQGRVRFPPGSPERKQWTQLSAYYNENESFRRELVQRFFSPATLARYEVLKKAEDARQEIVNQKERAQQEVLDRQAAEAKSKSRRLYAFLIAYAAYCVLMAFLVFLLLRGPHRLLGPDFDILQSGKNRYRIHSVTGTVVGGGKAVGQGALYLEFLLKLPDGREHPIQAGGGLADLVLREGHTVSAVLAIKEGDSRGSYILFRNHTTRQTTTAGANLTFLMKHNGAFEWLLVILLAPTCWGLIVFLIVSASSLRNRVKFVEAQITREIIPRLDRNAAQLA